MASIDEARFARNVRFDDGAMSATAAAATYLLGPGTLALSGSEPGVPRPHLVNERLTVDAARIDIVLAGPQVTAVGAVASELKPAKKEAGAEVVMPSMLDGDQPVSASAERLVYDGVAGRATYTGNALLWQGDTSIKGASLRLDEKTGDLAGTSVDGSPVVTTSAFDQKEKDGKVTRARSITTAKDFLYEEALRRATYTGDGHMSGPQGDLTAARIELYLKPAGDELERAEGYESVTLVEKNRKTTGTRMTYFSADERYVMTGTPVTIIDECGRETTGRTLTFFQATDRIVVDGNEEMRTQTRGSGSNVQVNGDAPDVRSDQVVRRPHRRARRQPRAGVGRDRRPARPERRRQDHDLLHDRRPDRARLRARRARRRGRDRRPDVRAGPQGHRLPAAGSRRSSAG